MIYLWDPHIDTWWNKELISYNDTCWLLPLPHSLYPPLFYIIEILEKNYIKFYLILSYCNSSFVLIFDPPLYIGPQLWRNYGTFNEEEGNIYNKHKTHWAVGGGLGYTAERAKRPMRPTTSTYTTVTTNMMTTTTVACVWQWWIHYVWRVGRV